MRRAVAAATLFAAVLTGCGEGDPDAGSVADGGGRLTVFAASSLTEAFSRLERAYRRHHPGYDVRFSFESSSTLAAQVVQGAPADVLATADETSMRIVTSAGLAATEPVVFATNVLVVAVPAGNPAGIHGVQDLAGEEVTFAQCDPSAPCGRAAEATLAATGVSAEPATLEPDVKAVLTKVRLGEVDAGLVYRSDAATAPEDVDTVAVPVADRIVNEYPIVVVDASAEIRAARDWVDLVVSPTGRRVLAEYRFGRS